MAKNPSTNQDKEGIQITLSFADFQPILQKGWEDLSSFFEENLLFTSIWRRAQDAVQHVDRKFLTSDSLCEFLSRVLPWLEQRKNTRGKPWVEKDGRFEIDDIEILDFLKHLKVFGLENLIMPGPYATVHLPTYSPNGSNKFLTFVKFIGHQRVQPGIGWEVLYKRKGEDEDLMGFVSWLVVSPRSTDKPFNSLLIIYDHNKMRENIVHDGEAVTRFEKSVLHEVGHSRTRLDWYLGQIKAGVRMAAAKPFFELEAWTYSLAVRTYIVSLRSWVTRVLKNLDNEWMSP